jgi:Spy/CpxP family protein refolding chaperone
MNTTYRLALGLASFAALPLCGALAQSADPTPTPSVSGPGNAVTPGYKAHGGHRGEWKAKMAALTPEERQELKAAREKALQDPAVKAAEANRATDHRAYNEALHAAMLRADPGVATIFAKLHPQRDER